MLLIRHHDARLGARHGDGGGEFFVIGVQGRNSRHRHAFTHSPLGRPKFGAGHMRNISGVKEKVSDKGRMESISKKTAAGREAFSPRPANMCCRTVNAACEYVMTVSAGVTRMDAARAFTSIGTA